MSQFKTEPFGHLLIIHCPMQLNQQAAADFNEACQAWPTTASMGFVLDLTGVNTVTRDFYRAVIQFRSALKREDKGLYTVNARPDLLRQFSQDGMEQAFGVTESIEGLSKATAGKTTADSLDVSLINPFLSATLKVLEVQCKTQVKALKPYMKKQPAPGIAIVGVLALASKKFSGSIALCFPESVFLQIYENMFGEKSASITAEQQDAAAELLNIIYGMAKIELNQKGCDFQKALPTVLMGEQLVLRQSGHKPALVIPFETGAGPFHIEIELNNQTGEIHV